MDTLLSFFAEQAPSLHPRYRYGLVRESAEQPTWIPPDAGLVDHLFLLFGLVESIDPDFFPPRVFPSLAAGDYNADGAVDAADYSLWKSSFGSRTQLPADGSGNGVVDAAAYTIWRDNFTGLSGARAGASATSAIAPSVPEPEALGQFLVTFVLVAAVTRLRRSAASGATG